MESSPCRRMETWLETAAEASPPASLSLHAEGCADCGGALLRQSRLEGLLRASLEAPVATVAAPRVLERNPLRVPAWTWAAAAAVLVVVVAGSFLRRPTPSMPETATYVARIVDLPEAPPPEDERLLALTDGVEAVAMRRPTEVQ